MYTQTYMLTQMYMNACKFTHPLLVSFLDEHQRSFQIQTGSYPNGTGFSNSDQGEAVAIVCIAVYLESINFNQIHCYPLESIKMSYDC